MKKINNEAINFNYANSCTLSHEQLQSIELIAQEEISTIQHALSEKYATDYASLNLPNDLTLITTINAVVKEKKRLNPTLLIVIGIGGSNLGTIAVLEALRGKFYNDNRHVPRVYFADTVDSDYINTIIGYAEKEMIAGNNIIVNVISKSGNTTETIANFQLFLEVLKKHRPYNYAHFIVITTNDQSTLSLYGDSEKITRLAIPNNVGGRYSVFSAVGLFPLALCGINIEELLAGAQSELPLCTNNVLKKNPAALSAAILFLLHEHNYIIHDTFLFSVDLEGLGKWYRQLMAESIGKSYDKNGRLVNTGITPTVSIGSTDLHSVAQLYLSGPYTTCTTFVSIENNDTDLILKENCALSGLVANINNKSLATIMEAILQGTLTAYQKNNRPFVHISIPRKTEYFIGQFMQMKMIEIIYLGFLMNINPFDQPEIELYKIETKKILASKK